MPVKNWYEHSLCRDRKCCLLPIFYRLIRWLGNYFRTTICNIVSIISLELTVTDSDADKIAAAKAVVEKVLADYIAVNDSTSEDIQNKINTALSSEV